ncbi:MAG: hypothetical protein GKR87_00710 [Kiritimatiellae bacterium]|nr:hypothetical protein [Kiritimatiellia bacterium]
MKRQLFETNHKDSFPPSFFGFYSLRRCFCFLGVLLSFSLLIQAEIATNAIIMEGDLAVNSNVLFKQDLTVDADVTAGSLTLNGSTITNWLETISTNQADGRYVNKTGDTISGGLSVSGDVSVAQSSTLDGTAITNWSETISTNAADGCYVSKSGDTMTGPLEVSHIGANPGSNQDGEIDFIDGTITYGGTEQINFQPEEYGLHNSMDKLECRSH